MQQMGSSESVSGQQSYRGYEGTQAYEQPRAGETLGQGPAQAGNVYDDDFIDAFAQRLSQRMAQGPRGKVYPGTGKETPPEFRLALAIVSIIALLILSIVVLVTWGIVGGPAGLVVLGVMAWVVVAVNAIYKKWGGH